MALVMEIDAIITAMKTYSEVDKTDHFSHTVSYFSFFLLNYLTFFRKCNVPRSAPKCVASIFVEKDLYASISQVNSCRSTRIS